jgi:hypothetical protein
MHLQRILCICIAILGISGTFMPWVKTKWALGSYALNGTEYNGWITFALFFICLIFALTPDLKYPIRTSFYWASFIAPLLAGIIVVADLSTIQNNTDNIIGQFISQSIELGLGIYAVLFASISLPISLLVTKNQ